MADLVFKQGIDPSSPFGGIGFTIYSVADTLSLGQALISVMLSKREMLLRYAYTAILFRKQYICYMYK